MALVVVQFVLSLLKPLTLFLQKTHCNMVSAFDEAKKLIQLLNRKRNDEQFDYLFSRAETIAERLEVDLKPKRRVGSQVTGYKPSETLAHKPFFPLIDHVISEMERRFPDDLKNHMTCTSNLTTVVNSVLQFMISGTTSILKS